MPHIDGTTGEIVIRIVYDGAPESGKTTNVQQLSNMVSLGRRGASTSPGTHGARTEFFDWLDFSGGFVDGYRVRCQLVSVPGQLELLHRRRYLLESADALVFVVDACAELDEASQSFALTRSLAETTQAGDDEAVPAALIVQANKQDLPSARLPEQISAALELPATCPVVGSAAASGQGVMETFVLAVRLATERARGLLLAQQVAESAADEGGPDALYGALLTRDREVAAEREAERLEDALQEATRMVARRAARARSLPSEARNDEEDEDSAEGAQRETLHCGLRPARPHAGLESACLTPVPPMRSAARLHTLTPAQPQMEWSLSVALPRIDAVDAGHIWPPVAGRDTLAGATNSELTLREQTVAWAPPFAREWRNPQGWILHSAERWRFSSELAALRGLMTQVRALLPHLALVPEQRALVLAREAEHYRLWSITPPFVCVRTTLQTALADPSESALQACLDLLLELSEALGSYGLLGTKLPAGSAGIAFAQQRLSLLALPGPDAPPASEPMREVLELLERSAATPAQRSWFAEEAWPKLQRVLARG